jgi:putative dimethyl sulfoxide reductase chaperone
VTDSIDREIAERRSQAYWALSRFFLTRPDVALVEEIQSRSAAGRADEPAGGAMRLRDSLGDSAPEPLAERLAREYTRLLRGLGEQLGPAPPYESIYRGGRLMDGTALAVAARMKAAGFADIAPEAGPPDHVGAELRFMALLCFSEAEAWSVEDSAAAVRRRQEQTAFLDEHLLAWVPAYCRLMGGMTAEPFYRTVAELTEETLREDRQFLRATADQLTALDSTPQYAGMTAALKQGASE